MFEKTFDQMQDLGRQWAAASRRMTREALRATSASLESAARYLHDLGDRVKLEAEDLPLDNTEGHDTGADDDHHSETGNGRAAGAAG